MFSSLLFLHIFNNTIRSRFILCIFPSSTEMHTYSSARGTRPSCSVAEGRESIHHSVQSMIFSCCSRSTRALHLMAHAMAAAVGLNLGDLQRAPRAAADLHAGVELCNDDPLFIQAARWHCAESAWCKRMYQVCKSRSECCTCCNGYAPMFQEYVSDVWDVYCKCFIWMLQK
jgi:hypothetical protein